MDSTSYPRRMRNCYYGDRHTHAVRSLDLVNRKTACDRWVWDKATDTKRRFAPVTCKACARALGGQA